MNFTEFKNTYQLKLDPQQEKAVQTVEGPVLLLAVPGSGKTTVLVSRIGYMLHVRGIASGRILTMTYTVAAAKDMRQRYASFFGAAEAERLEFRTINGVCASIIRLYERTMGRTAFQLLDDGGKKSTILSDLYRKQTNEYATESTIKAIETAITYTKNQMLQGEGLDRVQVEGCDFPALYLEYRKLMRSRALMDFDDQMVYAMQILRQYPRILQAIQNRYQYFCVDEAQDTSRLQHTIIRMLAAQSGNLFMVGDEDQSIYGFRAACPQALTGFERVYPQACVLYMEQNYRSTREIVAVADHFIQKNQNRHPKHMKAVRSNGPEPKALHVYDRVRQYRYLAALAEHCKTETAILYRDNDSALPLIDLLNRAGIPYCCRQMDSVFFSNRIVRDIVDIIRFSQDPYDSERFMNIYYKLGAGISRSVAMEAASNADRVGIPILEYITEMESVSNWTRGRCKGLYTHTKNLISEQADKAIYRIVHFMGYGDYLEERGADRSKADILEALGVDQPTPIHLLERLDELYEVVRSGSTGGADCPVVLSTIHSSKGLEYEHVILMDVLDGIFPKTAPSEQMTEDELESWEEERRLFYVGMTRAKQELSLVTFKREGLTSCFAEELFPSKPVKCSSRLLNLFKGKKPEPSQLSSIRKAYLPRTPVQHKTFGPGIVDDQNGDYVTILFQSGERKKFSLSAAIQKGLLWLD